ncbi:universal stress protein [Halorhabdus rudnickae]|uniref:universal stress protein n=1 Tax=Halorhabdus rudnickae TaxID=1775544 RepID=UPI0010834339|nr:universal stress protein [Halorhabdus rudnickae]
MTDPMSVPVQHPDGTLKTSSIAAHGPVSSPSYDILVPLPDAKTVDYDRLDIHRLLRTPLAIADDRNGSVTIASIVTAPSEISLNKVADASFSEEMTRVIDLARKRVAKIKDAVADCREDVPVSGLVIVGHVPDDVFAECTTGERYDAIFLAQGSRSEQRLWDESLFSTILETAACAVYLETLGTKTDLLVADPEDETDRDETSSLDDISSILLAVGTGPHSVLGAETARALGSTYGGSIRGVHLSESTDAERLQQGRKALDLTEYILSDLPDAEFESRESDNVVAELLQEIEKYDVAILGAPTKQPLLQRLFGQSLPDELEPQPTTSILTVRQPSHALDSVYYRWKQAIERTPDSEESPSLEGFEHV